MKKILVIFNNKNRLLHFDFDIKNDVFGLGNNVIFLDYITLPNEFVSADNRNKKLYNYGNRNMDLRKTTHNRKTNTPER